MVATQVPPELVVLDVRATTTAVIRTTHVSRGSASGHSSNQSIGIAQAAYHIKSADTTFTTLCLVSAAGLLRREDKDVHVQDGTLAHLDETRPPAQSPTHKRNCLTVRI